MSFLGGIYDEITGKGSDFGAQGGIALQPQTTANADAQGNTANAFMMNRQSYVNDAANMDNESAGNQALSGDRQINASSSKKGLLYSGLNEGAKGQNRSNIAAGLMQRRAAINAQMLAQQNQDLSQGANAAMGVAGLQQTNAEQVYGGNKAGSQASPGFLGGLLGGFG